MFKIISIVALLATSLSVFAVEGDACPYTAGNINSTFVATVNDGTGDILVSDANVKIRVPSILPVKFYGGLKEIGIGESVKFLSSYVDANNYCIATWLEVRPISTVSTPTNSNNKIRGSDRL